MFSTKSALFGALIVSVMGVQIHETGAKPSVTATAATDAATPTSVAAPVKPEEFHSYLDFCVLCDSFKYNPLDKAATVKNVNADDTNAKSPNVNAADTKA